jgi:RNA polymerase sigma-70 factor (family 1)
LDNLILNNESELLRKVAQGNEQAYRQIYDFYAPGLYRTARKYLHEPEWAEDIVQEVFLTFWHRRAEFSHVLSFRPYLFAMARNLCLKYLREKSELHSVYEEFSERIRLGDEDTLEEYRHSLEQAVEQLPPQQKQVFVLAKKQGMSHEAIARLLNLSSSTVNNHMTAALRALRHRLKAYTSASIYLLLSWLG